MDELVIYEKPTCSKCRAAVALLDKSGRPFRRIRYYEEPLTKEKLRELIRKSDVPVSEFVRTREPAFTALGKPLDAYSTEDIATLLASNPDLIERPILECGRQVTIGRPTERAAAFIASVSSKE